MKWPVPYCSWKNSEQQSWCIGLTYLLFFTAVPPRELLPLGQPVIQRCLLSQLVLISPQFKTELHFIGSKWPSIVNYWECNPISIIKVQVAYLNDIPVFLWADYCGKNTLLLPFNLSFAFSSQWCHQKIYLALNNRSYYLLHFIWYF